MSVGFEKDIYFNGDRLTISCVLPGDRRQSPPLKKAVISLCTQILGQETQEVDLTFEAASELYTVLFEALCVLRECNRVMKGENQ